MCIGLTLLLTVGLRYRDHEDEFHITTFFRVRFAGVPLLSTLELLLFGHSNIFVRAKAFFIGITSSGSI